MSLLTWPFAKSVEKSNVTAPSWQTGNTTRRPWTAGPTTSWWTPSLCAWFSTTLVLTSKIPWRSQIVVMATTTAANNLTLQDNYSGLNLILIGPPVRAAINNKAFERIFKPPSCLWPTPVSLDHRLNANPTPWMAISDSYRMDCLSYSATGLKRFSIANIYS